MRIDKMEFGMRVRSQFKTALEGQVGEAVVIRREQVSGPTLLNSKAEYNRCKINRIETRPTKFQYRDTLIEQENETLIKAGLKELNKLKRSRNKDKKKTLNTELKEACIEISNENYVNWKKRRKLELENREKTDATETENLVRQNRKNDAS